MVKSLSGRLYTRRDSSQSSNWRAMADDIQACKYLIVYQLEAEFSAQESTTIVRIYPEPILRGSRVALYAQSTSGNKSVFMRSPNLRRELERLADQGVGITLESHGFKWKFMKSSSSQ